MILNSWEGLWLAKGYWNVGKQRVSTEGMSEVSHDCLSFLKLTEKSHVIY